jgi:manganese/zinc/iron transport system permease protein
MDQLVSFFSLQDPNVRIVLIGMTLISISSALVGSFAFLRKKSLVGDAVAHSLLPGVVMAFMLTGSKNPWVLIVGALLAGWFSIGWMDFLIERTKLKADASIALVLSVMFGLGIMLLTHVQHIDLGNQSGLDKFLFGKAASLTQTDVNAFGVVTLIIVVLTAAFYKELKLISFNQDFGQSVGLPIKGLNFLLNTLLVLAIITGIQAVGVVLMAALLIAPVAAARVWTHKLRLLMFIAMGMAFFSSIVGAYVSYTVANMPTGPWIVVILTFFTVSSLMFAPKKGVLARLRMQKQNQIKINTENILKALYHIGEDSGAEKQWVEKQELFDRRSFKTQTYEQMLVVLAKRMWVIKGENERVKLTTTGAIEAARVVRLHRLWEMYLTQRMHLKSDHIHPNAETIEHIITPEIEKELMEELGSPERDPHNSKIPYT